MTLSIRDQAAIAARIPPEAKKVALIDYDGTLFPFGGFFDIVEPNLNSAYAVQLLKSLGYRIGIFTSRLSPFWLKSEGHAEAQHIAHITASCLKYDIPFDFITSEKVPAEFYIDDRAYRFENNWLELLNTILGPTNVNTK